MGPNPPRPYFSFQNSKDSHFSVSSDKSKKRKRSVNEIAIVQGSKNKASFQEVQTKQDFRQEDITLSVEYRNPLIPHHFLIIVTSKIWNLWHAENYLAGTGSLNLSMFSPKTRQNLLRALKLGRLNWCLAGNEEARNWLKTLNSQSSSQPQVNWLQHCLRVVLWNARSICNKIDFIEPYLLAHDISLFAITETWISDFTQHCVDLIAGSNYSVFLMLTVQVAVEVALLYYLKVNSKKASFYVQPCLECLGVEIILYHQKTLVIVGYRPPSGSVNHLLQELSSLLSHNTTMYSNVVILGDFNIALNKIGPHHLKFTYLMEEHGLVSFHSEATTRKGNLLDLVLMNKDVFWPEYR